MLLTTTAIWLLWLGMALLTLGIVKSVQEEWARQGIGDTSYTSLWLWSLGTACFVLWAVQIEDWALAGAATLPVLLYVWWMGLKMSSRRRSRHR